MKIFINDTNIFIDLLHVDLLEPFLLLPGLELKTTDFVMNELKKVEEQHRIVNTFCEKNMLDVLQSQADDLQEILILRNSTTALSATDCSIWHFAKKSSGIILSGDGGLRAQAQLHGIEVRGMLYIFDLLVKANLLHPADAITKLKILFYEKNSRLPEREVLRRVEEWHRS